MRLNPVLMSGSAAMISPKVLAASTYWPMRMNAVATLRVIFIRNPRWFAGTWSSAILYILIAFGKSFWLKWTLPMFTRTRPPPTNALFLTIVW